MWYRSWGQVISLQETTEETDRNLELIAERLWLLV